MKAHELLRSETFRNSGAGMATRSILKHLLLHFTALSTDSTPPAHSHEIEAV